MQLTTSRQPLRKRPFLLTPFSLPSSQVIQWPRAGRGQVNLESRGRGRDGLWRETRLGNEWAVPHPHHLFLPRVPPRPAGRAPAPPGPRLLPVLPASLPRAGHLPSSRIKTSNQEARRTGPTPEPRPPKRGDGRRKPAVPGARAEVGTTGRGPESSFGLTRSTKAGSRLGVARCPSGRGYGWQARVPAESLPLPAQSLTLTNIRLKSAFSLGGRLTAGIVPAPPAAPATTRLGQSVCPTAAAAAAAVPWLLQPWLPIRRRHQASGVTASPSPDTPFPSLSFFLSHLTLPPPPPTPNGSPSAVHVVTEQTDRGSQNGGRGGLSHPGHTS